MGVCVYCGNSGEKLTGGPCTECNSAAKPDKVIADMLEFNPVYGNIKEWNKTFITKKTKDVFVAALEEILAEVKRMRVPKNYFIFSDANTSRTVFSFYIQHLLKAQSYFIPPVMSLAELNQKTTAEILSYRVLFLKLVNDGTFNPAGRVEYLLTLRSKYDKSTIVFYTGNKQTLTKEFDYYGKIASLLDTGEFNSFKAVYGSTTKEVEVDD